MSRINVEDVALRDPRFVDLAHYMGWADADHARGKLEHVWLACTDRGVQRFTARAIATLLGRTEIEAGRVRDALVRADLARIERGDDGEELLYIAGSWRTTWLEEKRKAARKGGVAKAAKSRRQAPPKSCPPVPDPAPALSLVPDPAPAIHSDQPADQPSKSRQERLWDVQEGIRAELELTPLPWMVESVSKVNRALDAWTSEQVVRGLRALGELAKVDPRQREMWDGWRNWDPKVLDYAIGRCSAIEARGKNGAAVGGFKLTSDRVYPNENAPGPVEVQL